MAEKLEQKSLSELLRGTPAGGHYAVADFTLIDANGQWVLNQPSIQLFCSSGECGGYRFFDLSGSNLNQPSTAVQYIFMTYKCRNCRKSPKTFALRAMSVDSSSPSIVVKMGEFPFYGGQLSAKFMAFLGPYKELFIQGNRAENAGFGFGAFAYYRRVVEYLKPFVIDEIAKISRASGANEQMMLQFEKAARTGDFRQAVAEVGEYVPHTLMIQGQNPLILLRNALEEGIRAVSDTESLEVSAGIRIILSELAERISFAQADNGELLSAVNRLLNSQRKTTPE